VSSRNNGFRSRAVWCGPELKCYAAVAGRREMRQVADITPFGGSPGLIAFLCTYCGSSNSILVHAKNREVDHEEQE